MKSKRGHTHVKSKNIWNPTPGVALRSPRAMLCNPFGEKIQSTGYPAQTPGQDGIPAVLERRIRLLWSRRNLGADMFVDTAY